MFRNLMLFSVILFLASAVFAQDEYEYEGVGEGANSAEAILAAKRDAIEKGIGLVLLSQTEIENFQVKRDMVLTKTIGAVKNYQVISQSTTPDGLYKVKIKATVSKSAMRDDLAALQILIESMEKPKLMVIVEESNIDNNDPGNRAAENAITAFFKDPYGFEMVDSKMVSNVRNSKQKMSQLAGNEAEAAAIGLQYGAEVLISGIAISKQAEAASKELAGMISVQADVTLKAISCATGRVIASASEHAAKVHLSPQTAGTQAINKAAEKASGKLLDAIIKDWQNQANNGLPLNVSISNVSTFRQKNAVVQTIRGISGVDAVYERNWDAQTRILVVDVKYKGNSNGFASKVDGYKMTSGGGSLAVTGINGQSINLAAQAM